MTSQEMLKANVLGFANTLESVVAGTYDFGDDVDEDCDDAECCDESTPYDRLARYFEDVLDVEFRVDTQLRYKSAVITLACGGPGIFFDTASGEVRGYWGFSDAETAYVSPYYKNSIDEYFEEQYNCLRGCY